jgi:hypothetical protein
MIAIAVALPAVVLAGLAAVRVLQRRAAERRKWARIVAVVEASAADVWDAFDALDRALDEERT